MDLVDVAVFANDSEAELARSLLEANGIRAHFSGGIAWPLADGVPIGTILQVSKQDLKKARSLIKRAMKHRTVTHAEVEWDQQTKPIFRLRRFIIYLLLGFVGIVILLSIIHEIWLRVD